jgi:RimJ/RimL family protein N-acetyltransferase
MMTSSTLPDPIVRPLQPSDALERLLDDRADRERARAASAEHPLLAVVALEGEVVVGLLLGDFVGGGYRIVELHGRGVPALLLYVRRRFAGQRVDAVTPVPADAAREALLAEADFTFVEERVHYERSLDAPPTEADPFTYRAYADVGKARFLEALAEIVPPAELERLAMTARERLDTWLRRAALGPRGLDTSLWRLASLDGALAGVVLAQPDYPREREGTVLYLGLVPAQRGRGLGVMLHRSALEALRRAGAARYVDATAVDNAAMRRVMTRDGCVPCGGSRLFRLRRPPAVARVTSFAELVAHLRREDHAVELRDPNGWARALVRAVEHEAMIDLVWLADPRVLHVVHTFELEVPKDAVERMLRACGTVNGKLDVPGFIIDEQSRTLRYQLPLLVDDEGLSIFQLRRALATAVITVARSGDFWRELAHSGEAPRDWTIPWSE